MFEKYISIAALLVSCLAVFISKRESYQNGRPYFAVKSIKFYPKEFICYTNSSIMQSGYKKLSAENRRIIEQYKYKASVQNINDEYFILFNLLDENSDMENVRLILSPLVCKLENTGAFVNELEFIKGKTKIKGRAKELKYKAAGKIVLTENEIVMRVAYACKEGLSTSLLYERLFGIDKEIDYLKEKELAKEIINFESEKFWIKCKNNKRYRYKVRVSLKMDGIKGLIVD